MTIEELTAEITAIKARLDDIEAVQAQESKRPFSRERCEYLKGLGERSGSVALGHVIEALSEPAPDDGEE